ncbi:hypothetical protein vBAbaPP1_11 [Acinetobacter phage vB_AbaM_P1]|nr:hypothetical protein vBAbaPP1_11 [Acinetobacter phage vB_AbaM_P1]WAX22670.1 hypothetical protein [Acinetobacter phage vB_AbaP_HB01]
MSLKVWIAPVLAALALGVISCTQPNQAAHSAGVMYVNLEKNGKFYFESKLGSEKAPNLYRYIDCDAKAFVYTTYDGGMTSQPFVNATISKKFCGEYY